MTLEEITDMVWEVLGEPSDLDPDTVNGAARLTRYVNMAQRDVSHYRFPDGHILRFPVLEAESFFQIKTASGTINGAVTTSDKTVTLSTDVGVEADRYNGWVIKCGSDTLFITDYSGARVATLNKAWPSAHADATAFTLYKRYMRMVRSSDAWAADDFILDPVTGLYSIQLLENVTTQIVVPLSERTNSGVASLLTVGTPQEYWLRGNAIYFDVPVENTDWYRLEYLRNPTDLDSTDLANERPELPEVWHEAVMLRAIWWGFLRSQEPAMKYTAKGDFEDCMLRTRQQLELQFDRIDAGIEVEV